MALGREASGVVAAVGVNVTRFSSGDHVVLVFVPSCGQCQPRAAGRPALCELGAAANGQGTLLSGARRLRKGCEELHHYLRKIIARRAALDLTKNGVVNLGIGMPEGVSRVAGEEGILDHITLMAEPGVIGGMPQGGLDLGAAVNNHGLLNQNQQFDFYDGGGLDLAVLGMAEVDAKEHVNVSKFGPKLAGIGGFVNISQSARRVVFTGTAGGLKVGVVDGELHIDAEGRVGKFTESVEQITFNGEIAAARGQQVLYVTERCALELTPRGLRLAEVTPGIDIERDILALMPCDLIVDHPVLMEARIFRSGPMDLARQLGVHTIPGKGSVVQLWMHAERRAKSRGNEPVRHEGIAVANG
jgi:acyl CoA:acetate/3-ketoacid CoA transferase